MAKKSPPARRTHPPKAIPSRWRQILLLLTLVPMAAGIILFVAAWADWVFLGTQTGQTVAGALLAFFGFAVSNALQQKWLPTGGWATLGVAVALGIGANSQPWGVPGGIAFGILGLALILTEFVRQYRLHRAQ